MLGGLAGILVAAEIERTQIELQGVVDPYFVSSNSSEVIEFDVSTRGSVSSELDDFRERVVEILSDERGWSRAGVEFRYVESGGRMHVVLAEASVVGALSGCSSRLSCTVYPYVYLNNDRWHGGSESYNALGVNVAHYQEMVLNHEVGHYLGHDHVSTCAWESGKAPIMLQQSTGLRGCSPSYWPLSSELWVTRR